MIRAKSDQIKEIKKLGYSDEEAEIIFEKQEVEYYKPNWTEPRFHSVDENGNKEFIIRKDGVLRLLNENGEEIALIPG